jgi:hypothetical protein
MLLFGFNFTFSQEIDFKKIPMLFDTPNFFSNRFNTVVNDGKKIDTTTIVQVNSEKSEPDDNNIYNGVIVSKNQLDSISRVKYSLNLSEYKSMNDLIKGDLVLVDGIYQSDVGVVIELDLDKSSAKVAYINPDNTIGISWFRIKYLKKIIIN